MIDPVHPDHVPTTTRVPLVRSVPFGRPLYGTRVRCSCRAFDERTNTAPSRGGERELARRYRSHVEEAGA